MLTDYPPWKKIECLQNNKWYFLYIDTINSFIIIIICATFKRSGVWIEHLFNNKTFSCYLNWSNCLKFVFFFLFVFNSVEKEWFKLDKINICWLTPNFNMNLHHSLVVIFFSCDAVDVGSIHTGDFENKSRFQCTIMHLVV